MADLMPEAQHESASAAATRALDVSILIVTWNSERWIERCLQAIPAACEGLQYEIVVHDNASGDATLSKIDQLPINKTDGLQVIRSSANDGFAAGTNEAFGRSRGRSVFLLNPDCELEPRALTTLFEFLETHQNASAAAPLLIDERGDSQREFQLRRLPTLRSLIAEVLLAHKIFPKNRTTASYRYRDLDLTDPRRIEQPAAAALLLRRSVVEEIGPLDEQFAPAWFEDVDYCMRLAARGREVWVVPAAHARHYGGSSLEHLHFARFVDVWYRNMWRYSRKWMRPEQSETLRWVIIAGMFLRCGAALAGVRPEGVGRREAFRAYADVMRKAFDRWDSSSPSSS